MDENFSYTNRINDWRKREREKQKKEMCVKCQLSALFRLFSFLYVAEIERSPTCHTIEKKRERQRQRNREKKKQQ